MGEGSFNDKIYKPTCSYLLILEVGIDSGVDSGVEPSQIS